MQVQKYHIITYGCQMNVHESEKLAGILESSGYIASDNQSDADIIVINTCTIRQNADNRAIGNLGYIKKIKEANPNLLVCVFGCFTQVKGAAESLKKRFPFINIIFGTHNLHMFSDYLAIAKTGKKVLEIYDNENSKTIEGLDAKRTSGINAWVNIMYGCDNYCSYCIVPFVRGRERSREPELILDEIKKSLAAGFKEITLLGQNVNSYSAKDKSGRLINFASLLEQIAVLPYKFRVRFMTSHPKDLTQDVIDVVAKHPNLPEFFHLPVQAGSDRILQLMNRKYTKQHYLGLITAINKAMPSAGLSSDIMVGFPSETEEDFLETLDLVKKARFHNLFMFIYSPRTGTKAAEMAGQIPKEIADDRFKRLQELQTQIANELASEQVGKTFEILCDTFDDKKGYCRGKTAGGKIVSFKSNSSKIGEFIRLKITAAKNSNLIGEVI